MQNLVNLSYADQVSTIVMDDGKANVMSPAMLSALHTAFDDAERADGLVGDLEEKGLPDVSSG